MHLYWTIPGGGEYEQIIGRPWLYPSQPGRARRLVAAIYRLKFGFLLVSVLALWWFCLHADLRKSVAADKPLEINDLN
jgi:hypothetical protein